jgi:ribosome-binding factor A
MWHSKPFPSEAIPLSKRRRKKNKYFAGADPARLNSESEGTEGFGFFQFHAKPWNAPKRAGRKAQQLCRQVRDALHSALAGCGDLAVQSATVLAVEPAPHTGRLRVLVGTPPEVGRAAVEAGLTRAAGHLRAEVARAISRRYAPELAFEVIEL